MCCGREFHEMIVNFTPLGFMSKYQIEINSIWICHLNGKSFRLIDVMRWVDDSGRVAQIRIQNCVKGIL
jgi:hypothetical protein